MTTWFTSDTHFGHKNIIKYSNRPFNDVEEMNSVLIDNWNATVKPNDEVYHLGDFSLYPKNMAQKILDQLSGKKHLIIGNHDQNNIKLDGWEWVRHYHEITNHNNMIVLSHYAMRTWNKQHRGSWMLYGHSHGKLPDDPTSLSFDVGVDCHDMQLISFGMVQKIMKQKRKGNTNVTVG